MRARAIAEAIGTEPALRTVPEMVTEAVGTAVVGVMLVRETVADVFRTEAAGRAVAVLTAASPVTAQALGAEVTVGSTQIASRAAEATSRHTGMGV